MVESLREFDAETQRSTAPVSRVNLPPLTEFPLTALTASQTDDGDSDFRKPQAGRAQFLGDVQTLFDLREGTLVVLDEAEQIGQRATKSRDCLLADSASLAGDAAPVVLAEE